MASAVTRWRTDGALHVEIEAHGAVELGLVLPILLDLDAEKEVDAAAEQQLDLLARGHPDRLDARPALAQHDRPMTLALDVDHGAHRGAAILALLPALDLDRARI